MKLYHYTSYKNFHSIWESQLLKFGDCQNSNDIIEIERKKSAYTSEVYDELYKQIFEYRQISLTKDFCDCKKGFMSSMLWGHYADKGRGVCIELDFSKLLLEIDNLKGITHKEIKYVPYKNGIECKELDVSKVDEYLTQNIDDIFFTKLDDWKAENEYRMICNDPSIPGISIKDDAVTAIYISPLFRNYGDDFRKSHIHNSLRCIDFEEFVGNPKLIKFFRYTLRNGVYMSDCYSTKEQRELGERNKNGEIDKFYKMKQQMQNNDR